MKKIIVLVCLCTLLVGCKNEEPTSVKETEKIYDLSIEGFLQYVEATTQYEAEDFYVVKVKDNNEIQGYLLTLPDHMLHVNWYVTFDGKEIIEERDIGSQIDYFEEINIKQGTFVEMVVYNQDRNGKIILWDTSKEEIAYEFDKNTVDDCFEGSVSKRIATKFYLPIIGKELGDGYSIVLDRGWLESKYKDINNDGYEDIVFNGLRNIVTGNNEGYKVKGYTTIRNVYVYNEEKDQFVYEKDKSTEKDYKKMKGEDYDEEIK